MRNGTQDLTRATGASNCIPRTKSYDSDSATEGDQIGASQAQEQDEKKELGRKDDQTPQDQRPTPAGTVGFQGETRTNGSRTTAGPTILTDKDDDGSSNNGDKK